MTYQCSDKTKERFWSKVNKTSGCWIWTASKRNKGYGAFGWTTPDGQTIQERAHRVSWMWTHGEIPNGLCVLHRCDVPACVNPDHLFLGTKAENNDDMRRKGRSVPGGTYGAGRYKRKLTPKEVMGIRISRTEHGFSYAALSRVYGISISHAHRIVNGGSWKHLDEKGRNKTRVNA